MKNKKIIIAGGSGFIGQELVKYFGKENEIIVLGRQSGDKHKNLYEQKRVTAADGYNVRYVKWDGKTVKKNWLMEIEGSDLVINLTGKSVNCRYHRRQKSEIMNSRTNATKAIGEAIRECTRPPKLWINAASATIYRNEYENPNDEYTGIISDWKKDNMPFSFIDKIREYKNRFFTRLKSGKDSEEYKSISKDFSIQVCRRWEKTFFDERTPFTRKVAMRTAVTLGKGGVITPYINLCKIGMGGKHGNGRQMFSWVHTEDVARMINWLFENNNAEGVYNCVAPNAVTNADFMKKLRKTTGHVIGLPAPTTLLEFGAFLIRTETELMLKSRWVVSARALKEGFTFKYNYIEEAFNEIVSHLPRKAYHLF